MHPRFCDCSSCMRSASYDEYSYHRIYYRSRRSGYEVEYSYSSHRSGRHLPPIPPQFVQSPPRVPRGYLLPSAGGSYWDDRADGDDLAEEFDDDEPTSSEDEDSVEMCLCCRRHPKYIDSDGNSSDFCGRTCRDEICDDAPTILEIPSWDTEFDQVNELFIQKWKHPESGVKPAPTSLLKVYKVYSTKEHMRKFLQYKERTGNVRQRWHGTRRVCDIGNTSENTTFCSSSACSLCQILQQSFRIEKAGSRFNRFGLGIYTSATSSKAFDYIEPGSSSGRRAMMLCEVVMGKACIMTEGDRTLTQPPHGYDSVVGDPEKTAGLYYDEAVVYKNEAIRPQYLVIF